MTSVHTSVILGWFYNSFFGATKYGGTADNHTINWYYTPANFCSIYLVIY